MQSKTGLLAAAFVLIGVVWAVPLGHAQGADLPEVETGSSVYWTSSSGGTASNFRERVVTAGEDWVLYESVFEDDWYEPDTPTENLFLLFSGIDYRSCLDSPMPSAEERQAVKALRPFKEGDSVEISALQGGGVITVGEATSYFLMGKSRPAHKIHIAYNDEDSEDENLVVLDEADLTVAIDWEDESRDRVMSVTSGTDTGVPGFTEEDFGVCAPILTEIEN